MMMSPLHCEWHGSMAVLAQRPPLLCLRLIKKSRYSEALNRCQNKRQKGEVSKVMAGAALSQTEPQTRLRGLMALSINKRSAVNYWAAKVTLGTTRTAEGRGVEGACARSFTVEYQWRSLVSSGYVPGGLSSIQFTFIPLS